MLFSFFPNLFFILILCVVTVTDLRDRRIPDAAIIAAILVKIGHTILCWSLGKSIGSLNMEELVLAEVLLPLLADGLAVSLPLLLLVLLIEKLWKKEAIGGGDIKLIFVTGLYLGWEKNLWMLLLACVIGVVAGIIWAREKDCTEEKIFPFGPMIAIATLICMGI